MLNIRLYFLPVILFVIAGCAVSPQAPITLAEGAISDTSKVGIVMSSVPEIQTTYPGAGCLLCLAAASATNSTLSSYVSSTLSADEIKRVTSTLKDNLDKMGYQAVLIEEPLNTKNLKKLKSKTPNTAKFNFSAYKDEHGIDRLIIVQLNFVGVQRNYSSYIPTGDPQAAVLGAAYMVNLENHQYLWYKPLKIYQSAEGEWDEPPEFPGMTNAFYQALERAADSINEPFKGPETVSAN